MKNLKGQKYYWLFFTAILTLFFCFRNPTNPWDRVIQAEGLGYYAYLPAIFIQQDLTWEKTSVVAASYYNRDIRGDFLNQLNHSGINKYFPGIAFLWLPFFLLAHFLSLLFNYPPDGFSLLYQYAIAFAAVFYLTLGIRYCDLLLNQLMLSKWMRRFSVMAIVLGSNLLYNTIGVASQSHVYSFFLLSGFLYYFINYCKRREYHWRDLFGGILMLSISFCIRPTSVLMVLALPFFLNYFKTPFQNLFKVFQHKAHLGIVSLAFVIPIFITMLLWYLQTGKPVADSYVGEHFYFWNPEWFNFLFSFRKGWLMYHPIFFLSFAGFFFLAKKQQWLSLFLALMFTIVLVYVFSSWWIWTYSVPFGQRVMIDFYAFYIFLFAISIVHFVGFQRKIFIGISIFLVTFNLWRTYQYHKGIIPWEYVTKEIYFSSIFDPKPVARYLVNEPRIVDRLSIPVTPLGNGYGIEQKGTSGLTTLNIVQINLPFFKVDGFHHIRISTSVLCSKILPDAKIDLVLFLKGKEKRRESRFPGEYFSLNKATNLTFGFELPKGEFADSLVMQIFYSGSPNIIQFMAGEVELLTENKIPEFIP